jgi:TetR/AcrR family transcriptional regulator
VLESIIAPIMQASTPFNADGDPKEVLSAYIRSKIRISATCPTPPKCSPARSCTAPHLSPRQVEQLNEQARHNIECIQRWIDRGQIAHVDPHHLMFSIWAATQTYADFDWQISVVTARPSWPTVTTMRRPKPSFAWC